jgi:LacI family transcriptional regulator
MFRLLPLQQVALPQSVSRQKVKKRPTIKDVARKSGLSASTVSLAINNSGYVSEKTRAKVMDVVKELGYHPTRAARGLASSTSGNIGFIVSEEHFAQAEQFYTRVFLGTEFEARLHDYYVLLTVVGRRFGNGASVPRFLLERNVDGVIVAGSVNDKFIEYIHAMGLPVVLVDYQVARSPFSAVLIDNRNGTRSAVSHLLDIGHTRIGFIGADLKHPGIAERFATYRSMLEEHNITPDPSWIITSEKLLTFKSGCDSAAKVLAAPSRPDALLAANDSMAIGCLHCAKRAGLRIPEDIAIVGFDDLEVSSHVEPRLTSVRVHKEEMGKLAVRRLVDILRSKTTTQMTAHVRTELIVRESTAGKSGEYATLTVEAESEVV